MTSAESFRVERSTLIDAPPAAIFKNINDFHRWVDWSPYEKMDPAMAKTYAGARSGPGAIYTWAGRKPGSGRMEILQSETPTRVVIQLDFSKPMTAHNTAEFTLARQAAAMKVTWAMYGPTSLMSQVMGLFFSMDKLVGPQFAEGLANLKLLSERTARSLRRRSRLNRGAGMVC